MRKFVMMFVAAALSFSLVGCGGEKKPATPATTPAKTEPAKTEPAKTEPAKTEEKKAEEKKG